MSWKARLALLAAALWWGSLGAIGFLAVPLLFANASSPAVAGNLAGHLFSGQAWLSLGCGVVLLLSARDAEGRATLAWGRGATGFVLAGLLAALLQEFAIAPRILARENLAFWHAAGTAAYGLQWVCALVVLWKLAAWREQT
ncbi:DUF4149 domain-containing protein [Ramlibacter ginsenosidimutans]|uniref:DUF4149 domain-containing protein n=1 Tax=Ramlibacter ginsenosidimutans TaxID=502333 RepID=A0A934TSF8_9BURK|nr:DUF4149 domain-containing protein [Ramlibacter ginsenosidimutans]MBK6006493.1 DUF4149 domain-containing protein [Ramlibacter ginsenosidimutans]